jgi:ATP-dependent helicase HrpB
VSRASADQRRGRAGRTEAGVCYRLWEEPETQGLLAFADPEIRAADLSSLVLDCAEWGAIDLQSLRWLDPPSEGLVKATRAELVSIGALDETGQITAQGRRIRALPLPPRLARMVLAAAKTGSASRAALIAAVLVERGIGGNDPDLDHRLENFARDRSRRADDLKRLSVGWAKAASEGLTTTPGAEISTAGLLALGYPDRIAKSRGASGQFLLANGRAGNVDSANPLARAPYLVVAELQGRASATRIILAASASEDEIIAAASGRIEDATSVQFDTPSMSVRARRIRRLGAITLASDALPISPEQDVSAALAEGIGGLGVACLPWTKAQMQVRERVGFLKNSGGDWPDLLDEALSKSTAEWLQPFLFGKSRLSEINADDLSAALDALLPWRLRQRLDEEAPTHFEAPTGNRFAVDYEGPGAPALHIRVQELFGLKSQPSIANGRLPLTLNLLSPAHRPIQITRDLPGFWAGSWAAVKADMRGRYPRHSWPDDPANARPTARAKPRGT